MIHHVKETQEAIHLNAMVFMVFALVFYHGM